MKKLNILVLDDEQIWVDILAKLIEELPQDINIIKSTDPKQCISILDNLKIDLITVDLMMPEIDGLHLIHEISYLYPNIGILIVSGQDSLDTAVECMQAGASDFLVKDSEIPLMRQRLHRMIEKSSLEKDYQALVNQYLNPESQHLERYAPIVTRDERMKAVIGYAYTIESSSAPTLIQGETGTGKNTLVQCMLGDLPAHVLNCQADTEHVLLQLLGCARGYLNRPNAELGLLHQTNGISLILNQVEQLSLTAQAVLLDILSSHYFSPLGSNVRIPVKSRIISTSCIELQQKVNEGCFRADLFYKLSTHQITLPPLRERVNDLKLLVPHIISSLCREYRRTLPEIPISIYPMLNSYTFPGNISELVNILTDALFYSDDTTLPLLPIQKRCQNQDNDTFVPISHQVVFPDPLPTLTECGEMLIREALSRCDGSQKSAATLLGISPAALCRRIAKL